MIDIQHLGFAIGSKTLLGNVSFTLVPGEILAVVGPNGAGKSTLLKCLSGEIEPTSGTILARKQALQQLPPAQVARWRGVLPQISHVPFAFTAREIVLLGRSPHLVGRESHHDHWVTEAALEATDAAHLAERSVQTLSGGELQRVHLARVLAQIWEPDAEHGRLLLLDEPTSALDLKHQHSLLRLTRRWAADGTAVLIILHDLNLAAQYADRLLWLDQGKVAALGTPRETFTAERIQAIFEVVCEVDFPPASHPWVRVNRDR